MRNLILPAQRQDTEATTVVFRKWPNGDICALFPDLPHDRHHCMSYEHIGQHGGADYSGVVGRTKAATPDEYADLAAELRRIGYRLSVKARARSRVFEGQPWTACGSATEGRA